VDQFYFESGYLEAGYLTVVKEASAGLTPYFVDGYLPVDYFVLEGNAINGQYSLSALLTKVGDPVFAIGSWTTTVSTVITANVTASGQAAITATFTQLATISHIEGADLFAFSNAQLEAAVRRIRDNNITASAAFSVATDATRTRNTSGDDFAEFSFTANTVLARSRDHASSQSAAFSLSATISHIEGADLTAFSNAAVTATATRIKQFASDLALQFVFTATISHIEGADLTAFSNAALSATATRTRAFASAVSTVSSVEANVTRNPGIIKNLSSQFTQSANAVAIPRVIVSLSSAFEFFTDYDRIFAAPVAVSGGSYDTAVINTSTTKFGTGSLGWTMDTDVQPTSDVFWTGTEFVAANTSFKWTSSDGVSWTRTAITGAKIPLNYGNGYYFNGNQYSTDLNTWSTISATIPGSSSSFISSIGYTAGVYYIFTQYIQSGRYTGGYSTGTPGGAWTHTGLFDGGTTSTGSSVRLLDYKQENNQIAVVATGSVGTGVYVYHFNGGTVTSIGVSLPFTLQINTQDFSYEQILRVAAKSSTQSLRSIRDTQNPRRDAIRYTNGASSGSFVFGSQGGGDQENKHVINDMAFINNTWLVYTSQGIFKSSATVPTSNSDFTLVSDQSLGKLAFGASKYVSTRFYSNDATTWTASVPGNTTGYQGYLEYAQGDGSDLGNFSTIDFWAYVSTATNFSQWPLRIVSVSNQTNFLQFEIYKSSEVASPFIRLERVKGDVNDDQTHFVSSGDENQGWHHIRISASGSNLAVYWDGVRKIYRTDFYGTFAGKVRLQSSQFLIDDFLISDTLITDPSVASFTVPTIRAVKDANTDLLLRFDTDFSNFGDLAPVIPRASISAVATISATAIKTALAASSLGSQFTQTAEATVLVLFEAALASAASTSATILRIKSSGVTLDSAFTQTTNTDLSRTRTTSSVQTSAFTQSTEAVKTASIASALNSQATFTATISHIEGADLFAFTNGTLSAIGVVTRSAASTQTSAFTTTADNLRVRFALSDVSSAFTQSAGAIKTAEGATAITSQASTATSGQRIRFGVSDFVSASSLSATVQRVDVASAALTSVFRTEQYYIDQDYFDNDYLGVVGIRPTKTASANIALTGFASELALGTKTSIADPLHFDLFTDLTALTRVTYSPSKALSVAATISTTARKSAVASSTLSNVVSFSAAIDNRTRSQSSSLASQFTVVASVSEFQGLAVLLSSAFTQTANNTRTRAVDSAVNAAATQSVIGNVTRTVSSTLVSNASLSCTISHIEGADIVANAFATLSVNVFVGKVGEAILASTITQTANAERTRGVTSNLSSAVTVTAAIDNRTRSQTASLTTAVAVTCTISHIEGADLVAFSASTVTTTATKTVTTSLTATSASNLTVTADRLRGFNANFTVSTSLFVDPTKLVTTQATLQAQATIQANATRIKQFAITIASAMTFVAAVREINAASLTQFVYTIPREDYVYIVPDEVPVYNDILYVIPNENWIYNITEETRLFPVEQETRIYNIRST
jgi:hypothetical protein